MCLGWSWRPACVDCFSDSMLPPCALTRTMVARRAPHKVSLLAEMYSHAATVVRPTLFGLGKCLPNQTWLWCHASAFHLSIAPGLGNYLISRHLICRMEVPDSRPCGFISFWRQACMCGSWSMPHTCQAAPMVRASSTPTSAFFFFFCLVKGTIQ